MQKPKISYAPAAKLLVVEGPDAFALVDPLQKHTHRTPENILAHADNLITWALSNTRTNDMLERVSRPYLYFSGWRTDAPQPAEDGGWDFPGDPRMYPLVSVVNEFTGAFLHLMPADVVIGWDAENERLVQSRFD